MTCEQVFQCLFFEESDFGEKFISLHIFNIPLESFFKSQLCIDIETSNMLKFYKLVPGIGMTDSPSLIYIFVYFPSSLQ